MEGIRIYTVLVDYGRWKGNSDSYNPITVSAACESSFREYQYGTVPCNSRLVIVAVALSSIACAKNSASCRNNAIAFVVWKLQANLIDESLRQEPPGVPITGQRTTRSHTHARIRRRREGAGARTPSVIHGGPRTLNPEREYP